MKINDSSNLFASIQLKKTNQALSSALEKIASGQRINKAADDSASLIISNEMDSQIRGMGQSIRNANDSIAMNQIADGALGEVSDVLMGVREKAVQAVNASHSVDSRKALQSEVAGALSSIDSIVKNTSYNGKALLDGNFTNASEQSANLSDIDLTTQEGAEAAIAVIDEVIQNVDSQRAEFGAKQNQATSEINNLTNSLVNTASARSSVMDTDLAEEIMFMKQAEVLNQTGTFAQVQLGKINQANITDLLQG